MITGPEVHRLVIVGALAAAACQPRPAPAATQQNEAAARPATAAKEDWSLYASKPNAQDALVLDVDSIAATHTDWPLVVAQLKEFRRQGQELKVKLVFRNEGVEMQRPLFIYKDVHLVDPDTGAKYDVMKKPDGGWDASLGPGAAPDRFVAELDPGQSTTVLMTFAAPPPATKFAGLEIPDVSPLARVAIEN